MTNGISNGIQMHTNGIKMMHSTTGISNCMMHTTAMAAI